MENIDYNQIFKTSLEKQKKEIDFRLTTQKNLDDEYSKVNELLDDLPKKLKHEVMVPIGSLAFMPGTLVNTNELMVLLGENWFALRSAEQTKEIMNRRIDIIKTEINSLKNDIQLINDKLNFSTRVFDNNEKQYDENGLEIVEIKEEYNSDEEKKIKPLKSKSKSKKQLEKIKKVKSKEEIEEEKRIMEYLNKLEEEEEKIENDKEKVQDEKENKETDTEILAYLNQLEKEEKEVIHIEESDEEYKPYPTYGEEEDGEEGEEENYKAGLNYAMGNEYTDSKAEELKNAIKEFSESQKSSNLKEQNASENIKKMGNKKQVRFSKEVGESSHRTPDEFRSNPFFDMLSAATLDTNTMEQPYNIIPKEQSLLSQKDESKKNISVKERDTSVMKMKVKEKDTPKEIDHEKLEGVIENQMLTDLYYQRKSEMLSLKGGYTLSEEELEERKSNSYIFEEHEEELSTSSSNQNKQGNIESTTKTMPPPYTKPKKVSKFKAARMMGAL